MRDRESCCVPTLIYLAPAVDPLAICLLAHMDSAWPPVPLLCCALVIYSFVLMRINFFANFTSTGNRLRCVRVFCELIASHCSFVQVKPTRGILSIYTLLNFWLTRICFLVKLVLSAIAPLQCKACLIHMPYRVVSFCLLYFYVSFTWLWWCYWNTPSRYFLSLLHSEMAQCKRTFLPALFPTLIAPSFFCYLLPRCHFILPFALYYFFHRGLISIGECLGGPFYRFLLLLCSSSLHGNGIVSQPGNRGSLVVQCPFSINLIFIFVSSWLQ